MNAQSGREKERQTDRQRERGQILSCRSLVEAMDTRDGEREEQVSVFSERRGLVEAMALGREREGGR